jgi:predicted ATPase/DNA-binding CsgD family transcriptional regulator
MSSTRSAALNDYPPAKLSSFVGRDRELEAICALLRQGVRLLTLTGPGGIGKTRLAVEIATALRPEYVNGFCYVPLAPITDPNLVIPTIARALGLRERGARTPWEELLAHVQSRHLLLVLDNFEQVADAAPIVANLLASCPSLTVLVTSRAVLRLTIERDYPVSPLELPDLTAGEAFDQIERSDAVNLFVARARAVRSDFKLTEENAPAVAEICQRLDGLPLAIELAAVRIRHLSPNALLERLERRLPLLSAGLRDQPERLRTMRGAIAWSYDLLDEAERRLFCCVSIFVGGFSLDAAEAVVSAQPLVASVEPEEQLVEPLGQGRKLKPRDPALDSVFDGLDSLVAKSLLRLETLEDIGARFGMLETIREFGLEQLAARDEAAALQRAHAAWCLELAERTEPELHGPTQHRWWRLLETEHDNFRSALSWLELIGDVETSLRLAAALASFWWFGGHLREGRRWLERALAHGDTVPALVRAQALEGAGFLAQSQGDDVHAVALLERSLTLYREIDDAKGIASTLYSLGVAAEDRGAYDQATDFLTESATRSEELGDHRTKTFAILHLGIVAYGRGDLKTAVVESETGIMLARAINSTLGEILGRFCLALVATARGESAHAAARYREIVDWLDAADVFGDVWPRRSGDSVSRIFAAVASLAVGCGLVAHAARLFGAAAADYEAIGQAPALPERIQFERATSVARGRLGDSAFDAAWATGQGMTPFEARADVEDVLTTASECSAGQEASPAAVAGLTPREQEVLRLLIDGRTDREIGATLSISPHTVTGHVARILAKLDVPNRTAAVNYAVRHDLH